MIEKNNIKITINHTNINFIFKSYIKKINISPKLKQNNNILINNKSENIDFLYINIYTPKHIKIREKLSPAKFNLIKKDYIKHINLKQYINFNYSSPLPSILFNTIINEKLDYLFEDNNFTFFYDDIYAVFINLSNKKGLYIKVDPFKEIAVIQDNIIFFITSILEYLNNNLILHGLGLRIKNKTSIFLGPSGMGKSTIAKYFNYKNCYGDDAILIDPTHNTVYPLPFYQYFYKYFKPIAPSKIDFILFLNKSKLSFLQENEKDRKSLLTKKYNLLHFVDFLPELYKKKVITNLDKLIITNDNIYKLNLKFNDYFLIKNFYFLNKKIF